MMHARGARLPKIELSEEAKRLIAEAKSRVSSVLGVKKGRTMR